MQTMKIPAHETVGHKLPVWETKVDRKRQECFHNAAAVSGAPFGDLVDVSVLSNDCLHGARPRDALGAKRLHVGVGLNKMRRFSLVNPWRCMRRSIIFDPIGEADIFTLDFAFASWTVLSQSRSIIKV